MTNRVKEKLKMLEVIENKNVTLKGKLNDIEKNDKPSKTSSREELKLVEELTVNVVHKHLKVEVSSKCIFEKCMTYLYGNPNCCQWKIKVSRLKSCLFSDLCSLVELEISRQQTCTCRGFCGITHSKQNLVQSSSENIITKLKTNFMKESGSDKLVESGRETKLKF